MRGLGTDHVISGPMRGLDNNCISEKIGVESWHIVSMNLILAGSVLRKYCFMFEYLISSNKKFKYLVLNYIVSSLYIKFKFIQFYCKYITFGKVGYWLNYYYWNINFMCTRQIFITRYIWLVLKLLKRKSSFRNTNYK